MTIGDNIAAMAEYRSAVVVLEVGHLVSFVVYIGFECGEVSCSEFHELIEGEILCEAE